MGCSEHLPLSGRAAPGHGPGGRIVDVLNGLGGCTQHGFGGPQGIGIAGAHRDGLAHIGLREHILGAGGPRKGLSIAQPLIADDAQPIGILQVLGECEFLALRGRAGQGHRAGRQIVDVGNGVLGAVEHRVATQCIGAGRFGAHQFADKALIRGQIEGLAIGPDDFGPDAIELLLPAVNRIHLTVCIGQLVPVGAQRAPFLGRAGHGQRAGGRVVHIEHGLLAAGEGAGPPQHIGGGHDHTHHLADIALIGLEVQALTRGAGPIDPRPVDPLLPSVGAGGGAIRVDHPREVGGEQAAFEGGAREAQAGCGGIVHIHHGRRGRAGHTFQGAQAIGVAHPHRQHLPHIGLRERARAGGGPINGHTIGQPLVRQGPPAIGIGQLAGIDREHLTLSGRAIERDHALGRMIALKDGQAEVVIHTIPGRPRHDPIAIDLGQGITLIGRVLVGRFKVAGGHALRPQTGVRRAIGIEAEQGHVAIDRTGHQDLACGADLNIPGRVIAGGLVDQDLACASQTGVQLSIGIQPDQGRTGKSTVDDGIGRDEDFAVMNRQTGGHIAGAAQIQTQLAAGAKAAVETAIGVVAGQGDVR